MTREIYYAQLVEEKSTVTVMAAWREVIEQRGLFCALYSDRASHFFHTSKRVKRPIESDSTQVGRALTELGIRMIPAYSPQARRRSERNFGTWQGRRPQELRVARGAGKPRISFSGKNTFPSSIESFGFRPRSQAAAFLPLGKRNLDFVFSLQHERVVSRDNTVQVGSQVLQIEKTPWRGTLAGCRVIVHEHREGTWSVGYGPHVV